MCDFYWLLHKIYSGIILMYVLPYEVGESLSGALAVWCNGRPFFAKAKAAVFGKSGVCDLRPFTFKFS